MIGREDRLFHNNCCWKRRSNQQTGQILPESWFDVPQSCLIVSNTCVLSGNDLLLRWVALLFLVAAVLKRGGHRAPLSLPVFCLAVSPSNIEGRVRHPISSFQTIYSFDRSKHAAVNTSTSSWYSFGKDFKWAQWVDFSQVF